MESSNRVELIADGLSYPTSLAFDDEGVAYVAESGLPFGGEKPGGHIWRIAPHGNRSLLMKDLRPPVNGLTYHKGYFYVSEGGHPARISRIDLEGKTQTTILENLPGPGNYHTNMVVFGPDGKLYFSQGAMTNTGIVGLDAYELGWLRRLPHAHDLPGCDIELAGVNVETTNPLSKQKDARTKTGAFVPFGTRTEKHQRIKGELPCTAAVMRCNSDGTGLELFAWGIRNAYGLNFLSKGRLLATDQGADDRGSRPVGNVPDLLFEVRKGAWYGWPDFIGDEPITNPRYRPERGPSPTFILLNHDEMPQIQRPLLRFPSHAAAVKFEVVPEGFSDYGGHIFVALFGDERPMTAPEGPRAGRAIARIDPTSWTPDTLIVDRLNRPIDVRFNQGDGHLYFLDFGNFEMSRQGVVTTAKTGKLFRFNCMN